MRIIYLGTPALALPVMRALHGSRHEIALVVTQPDRPSGRGRKLCCPPVKEEALAMGLPLVQPESVKTEEFHHIIASQQADLLLVVAFTILPSSLFSLTRLGAVNVHSSLLPRYRGAAPVPWTIINGDRETGVSLFQLDARVDHGQVLSQVHTVIGPEETAGELAMRLMELAAGEVLNLLDKMESGSIAPVEQDHTLATPAPKLQKEDGQIDWTKTNTEIHNRIRGFNPYPVCFTCIPSLKNKTLRIFRAVLHEEDSPGPGIVRLSKDGYPLVGCGTGMLKLTEVQLEGKPRVSGDCCVNGIQNRNELVFK